MNVCYLEAVWTPETFLPSPWHAYDPITGLPLANFLITDSCEVLVLDNSGLGHYLTVK